MKRSGIASLFVLVAFALVGASAADQGPAGQTGAGQAAPAGRGQAPDGRAGGPPAGRGGGGGGGFAKRPGQLASGWNASSTVARTTLRHEWVDIGTGANKVRTWIEYPEGEARAGVVIVMSYEAGLDDWIRSVADELATSGYIALAPDVLTGLGPNGGNYDAFRSPDEAILATRDRVTADRAMRQCLAAAEYAAKLPRSNGKLAGVGFGPGGTFSFRFAAEAPAVNAAVVFYGPPPSDAVLQRVKVPMLGFYGEDDPPITGTVEATAATLRRAGKSFDYQIYPGATHHFGLIQVEGRNGPAVQDAWTRTLAFFKEHLQ